MNWLSDPELVRNVIAVALATLFFAALLVLVVRFVP
jgi:hypothetical protein